MAEKLARIRPTWYNTLVESHNKMYDREQSTLPHLCDSTPHDLRQGVLFYQKPPIKKAAVVAAARAIHSEVSTVNDSDSTLFPYRRQPRTSLAPSERHLEDYLWTHPEVFGVLEDIPDGLPIKNGDPTHNMLFRQYALPSGIVDLVAYAEGLVIIELKRGPINAAAVAQIMCYMSDMRRMWDLLLWEIFEQKLPGWKAATYYDIANGTLYDQLVSGILIGSDITDEKLITACATANVTVYSYAWDGERYSINCRRTREHLPLQEWQQQWREDTEELTTGRIADESRALIVRHLQHYMRFVPFDAAEEASDYLDALETPGGES